MSDRYEFVLLHDSGSIPGIPGSHGRGSYVIDWQERAIHPAASLEDYVQSLESAQPDEESTELDASVSAPDGQETGQDESAAITALPQGTAFLADMTLHTAQSPQEPLPEMQGEIVSAPDNDAHTVAVGGNEHTTESSASAGA